MFKLKEFRKGIYPRFNSLPQYVNRHMYYFMEVPIYVYIQNLNNDFFYVPISSQTQNIRREIVVGTMRIWEQFAKIIKKNKKKEKEEKGNKQGLVGPRDGEKA